jgi:hypothetical protein
MAVPIALEADGICLSAVLNDTAAAQDLLRRLPLSVCGRRLNGAYRCGVAIGRFDPLETQFGWRAGDVCLDSGWLSLQLAGRKPSEVHGSTMVVGCLDRESLPLLGTLPDQARFAIRALQTENNTSEQERNAS